MDGGNQFVLTTEDLNYSMTEEEFIDEGSFGKIYSLKDQPTKVLKVFSDFIKGL